MLTQFKLRRMRFPFSALKIRLEEVNRDLPYLLRIKARMLAWFSILVILFVPLNIIKLLVVESPMFLARFGFNAIFFSGALLAINFLLQGKIQTAGSAIALISALPVHGLLLLIPEFKEPLSAATTLFFYELVCLLIALVFASRRVASVVLLAAVGSMVFFHFRQLNYDSIPGSIQFAADTLLRDGLIAMGFTFCLGIALAYLNDIAHRQNELILKEIRATNENLESIVAERTRDLKHATQVANEASSAKGEFLANMSHELRTPLHAIIASSELLLDRDDLPSDAAEKARIIAGSGDLLMRQIGDILDLSKIEEGHIELENQPFSLSEVVKDCVELMDAKAKPEELNLKSFLAPQISSFFLGDQYRLRQILLNLISNAVKFTPSGGNVEIRVLAVNEGEKPLSKIRFEVEDSGIGMDEATTSKIFGRYNQADSSTTRKYGGTGLGLAISMNLVELMGGRLEARSRPGMGSVFFFTLALEATSEQAPPKQDLGPAMDTLNLFILAADDNAVNRKVIGMQLKKLGFRHALVKDGVDLLAFLQKEPLPDLILTDCEMPNLDGREATRQLRSWANDPKASAIQKQAAHIPVIALTAATLADERIKCIECGMTDYLSKPLKIATLKEMLRKIFSNKI